MIQRIKEIIETEKLNEQSKKPNKVYRRWFLFIWLRKNKFLFREISEMFNMHHATILHGIIQAEIFEKQNDELYFLETKDLYLEFKDKKIIFKERNLIEDILNCKNLHQLSHIKTRLQHNQYNRENSKLLQ